MLAVLCGVGKFPHLSESSLFLSEIEMICALPSCQGVRLPGAVPGCNDLRYKCRLSLPTWTTFLPLQHQAQCRACAPLPGPWI